MQILFVLPAGVIFLIHGATIYARSHDSNFGVSFVFVSLSIALWIAAVNFLAFPVIRRINEKLVNATSLSERMDGMSGAFGVFVSLTLLLCAGGTTSASLGGVRFAHLPCSVFTSFGWMHVIVGVAATALPLLMDGYRVLAGSSTRHAQSDHLVDDHS